MAKLTPDATRTEHGLVINEKIIPWGAVWPKDSGAYKKGAQYKADRLLSGGTGKVKGVTIHNTNDLKNVEEDAEQYTRATWPNANMNDARVHYYVDDINAWQNLREDEVGWHAGDGRKATGGNETTLSIEIIMDGSGSKEDRKAEENGVLLAALLLKKHGLSVNELYTHNHWMGHPDSIVQGARKNCPLYILPHWAQFKQKVAAKLTELNGGATTTEAGKTEIMGKAKASAQQMALFARSKNAEPQLPACSLEQLAQFFLEEGEAEGVRGDVAFAQSLHETGFFKYGGIVLPTQNNYAGIGALNGNAKGQAATFPDPRTGVRAQIQHLKAYASKAALVNGCVDPRFSLVTRGSAQYVEWLGASDNPNGKGWAVPGKGYVAPYVFRLLHMLDRPARFVVCDGDIVEPKNLDRQNFVPADLGENKARVLAERYSTVLGMETEYVPNFIEKLPDLMELIEPKEWELSPYSTKRTKEMVLLLGCVDNNKTRQLCHQAFHQSEELIYIDSGNGKYTGQVVCGVRRNGRTIRKSIGGVHPEMLKDTDLFPSEISCAEAAQEDPQSIVANVTAATAVLIMVYNILTHGENNAMQTDFSTRTIRMQTVLEKKTRRRAA